MDRLDGMRLFARVVETESFSEGARQESIGQATVSKITTSPRSLTLVSLLDVGLNDDTVVGLDFLLLNAGMVGGKERVLTCGGHQGDSGPANRPSSTGCRSPSIPPGIGVRNRRLGAILRLGAQEVHRPN